MKPLISCLAAAVLCAACGDSKPPATATAPSSSPPPASAEAKKAPSTNVYERVAAEGKGFSIGSMMAARPVYVFFDAQCPHCATLWKESKPLLGQIRMVWMPVRLMADLSGQQGAMILAAQDPAAEMDRHEQLRDQNGKGLAPAADIPKDQLDKVRSNTQLLSSLGAGAVPTIIYINPVTGQPASVESAMNTEELRKLLGL